MWVETRRQYHMLGNATPLIRLKLDAQSPTSYRLLSDVLSILALRTMEEIIMSDELAFRPPSSHVQSCQQQQTPYASGALEGDISTRNKHECSPTLPNRTNETFRPFEAKFVTFSEATTATTTSPRITGITPDLAQGHINTPSIYECSKESPRDREDLGQLDPSMLPRCLAGYEGPESEPPICKFVVGDEPSYKHTQGQDELVNTPDTHTVMTSEVIASGADAEEEKEATRFPCNQDKMHMSESELDFDALAAEDWLDDTYAMLEET